jgi:hypothetical protein
MFSNKVCKAILVCLVLAIGSSALFAQITVPAQDPSKPSYPNITFNGQIRYRSELDGRFFDGTQKPLFINMLRSQVSLKFGLSENITALVRVQDSRNFGETQDAAWRGTLDGRADNLDFREAWLEWRNFLVSGLSLKLGRQIFATNNERLIGALEWHNVGRSYDGATLVYATPEKTQIRAFGFVLGNDELLMTSAERQNPQGIIGIDLTLALQQAFNIFLYHDRYERKLRPAAFVVMGDSTSFQRTTAGLYLKNVVDGWEYEFEGAYQFGVKQDIPIAGQNSNISAYLLTGYMGKRFTTQSNQHASVGIGLDYYTGDNLASANVYEGFNHLTTTIHKFYGYMDFFPFAILPNAGLRRTPAITNYGLFDPYVRLTYAPDAQTDMYIAGHYFVSQQSIVLPQGRRAQNIGVELDATLNYKITSFLQAQCGWSVFIPNEVMRETNPTRGLGTDLGYWGYVMLTATL